ncbi:hypothetical protein [Salinicoccus bachuensis]|uniref:Uncharacterized protein n=1 Tax=Salinicoccus bachuensis TaxID=3136731 RepID=A0ABZ3CK95_9STAP
MEKQAVIISEDEDTPIFNYDNIQETGSLKRYHHSLAYIIDEGDDRDHLLKFSDGKLGWVKLENSIYLGQKDKETVKMKEDPLIFDRKMNPNKDLSLKLSNRLCTSSYTTLHNKEMLEAINFRGKLAGFVKKDSYHKAVEVSEYASIKKQVPLYQDSDQKIKRFMLNEGQEVLIQVYFRDISLAKVSATIEGKEFIGWIKGDFDLQDNEDIKTASNKYDVNIEASANVISELMDRIIKLEEDKTELREKYSKLEKIYRNLRSSRLGKLQIYYWNLKKGRR